MEETTAKKTAQDIQDEIFRNMTAGRKIKLASDLTMLCLTLNNFYGNKRTGKTTR